MDKRDFVETQRFLKEAAASLQHVAAELGRSNEVAQAKVQAVEALKALGVAARSAAKAAGDSLRSAAETAKGPDGPASGPSSGDQAPTPPALGA